METKKNNIEKRDEPKGINIEDELLDPDIFFQTKICKYIDIKIRWLHEADRNERFRLNQIQEIKNSEKQSTKAEKILRDYLKVKRRDNFLGATIEKDRNDAEKQEKLAMAFKALTVKNTFMPASGKKSVERNELIKTCRTPLKSKAFYKTFSGGPLATTKTTQNLLTTSEKDTKKALVSTAEELQRQIIELEHNIGRENKIDNPRFRKRLEKSIEISRAEQAKRHGRLSKDAVVWARTKSLAKTTEHS